MLILIRKSYEGIYTIKKRQTIATKILLKPRFGKTKILSFWPFLNKRIFRPKWPAMFSLGLENQNSKNIWWKQFDTLFGLGHWNGAHSQFNSLETEFFKVGKNKEKPHRKFMA